MAMNVLHQTSGNGWILYHGDCVEVARGLPDNSIGYSIFSPPFASLYTYSNSERDMGNCRNDEGFREHFGFLVAELFRILKPGRLLSFHCMNLPMSKQHHGVIGIRDFRGELIRAFTDKGFIMHSEVCIWKDPVTAMQRTKAIGLLHKQIVKDSCMSRQGVPDYLVTMRKPGVNEEPVSGQFDKFIGDMSQEEFEAYARREWNRPRTGIPAMAMSFETYLSVATWQKYASPVWMDINPSDTLQRDSAREEKDERHICPLQLQVIARGLELWSNPGDVVLSPFAGICSEGYESIRRGRRFVGIELKESYYTQGALNMKAAERFQTELLPLADCHKEGA